MGWDQSEEDAPPLPLPLLFPPPEVCEGAELPPPLPLPFEPPFPPPPALSPLASVGRLPSFCWKMRERQKVGRQGGDKETMRRGGQERGKRRAGTEEKGHANRSAHCCQTSLRSPTSLPYVRPRSIRSV